MTTFTTVENLKIHENCRVCGSNNLVPIISLGSQCLINFTDSSDTVPTAPLELLFCDKKNSGCGLLQLKHTVPSDLLYRKFWYRSGINQSMRDALQEITNSIETIVPLQPNDIVLDIGSNDSTLLRSYKTDGLRLIGFEPAENLMTEANVGTTKIINNFFNYNEFNENFANEQAKIITSISMFYDLEEPNKFVEDIVKILDEDGIWIIQMNYLVTMLENNAFDNIVHEHLEYYSLNSLEYLLSKHNLEVFDVSKNNLNGGSIRTYVKHKNCDKYQITKRVQEMRNNEKKLELETSKPYIDFSNRIQKLKNETYEFINNETKNGKKVYVYGASTRGNTLLQYYNLDSKLIKAAAERNPEKWGKKIVGSNIPIISEEQARNKNPDYFLILPWYFIDEFLEREKNYLDSGGKFIIPLPEFKLVTKS